MMVETSWIWRRTAVFMSLVWCLGLLAVLAVFGHDTALHRSIAEICGWVVMFDIGVYTGVATYDDLNRMRFGRMAPDQTPPPTVSPPMRPIQRPPNAESEQ